MRITRNGLALTEDDLTAMYEMELKTNTSNAIEATPIVLAQIEGVDFGSIDVSAAKLSDIEAIQIETAYSGKWNSAGAIIVAAANRMLLDHNIRSTGKQMASKFDGKDVVTGKKFQAGEMIVWSGKFGCTKA